MVGVKIPMPKVETSCQNQGTEAKIVRRIYAGLKSEAKEKPRLAFGRCQIHRAFQQLGADFEACS